MISMLCAFCSLQGSVAVLSMLTVTDTNLVIVQSFLTFLYTLACLCSS